MELCCGDIKIKMTKSIKEYIKDYYTIISEGKTIKDKFILFLHFIKIPLRMFYRAIGKKYQPLLPSYVTIKNQDGIFFCGSSFLMAQGAISTYEPENKIHFNLEKGIFIDIGANIGKYTVMQARKLGAGKVIAIEPEPRAFEILKKNIGLNNLKNVIPLKIACSDSNGTADFWLGAKGYGTAHSLTEIRNTSRKISVNTETLDNIMKKLKIEKVDLIKVDVEGAEPRVFRGAKNVLQGHPKIIFEALNNKKLEECKRELLKYNYKINRLSERDFYAE
jgi:FkbM family methyltransferase